MRSPNSLIVSGHCDFRYDPATRKITEIRDHCLIDDPDNSAPHSWLSYMIGIGADVRENARHVAIGITREFVVLLDEECLIAEDC